MTVLRSVHTRALCVAHGPDLQRGTGRQRGRARPVLLLERVAVRLGIRKPAGRHVPAGDSAVVHLRQHCQCTAALWCQPLQARDIPRVAHFVVECLDMLGPLKYTAFCPATWAALGGRSNFETSCGTAWCFLPCAASRCRGRTRPARCRSAEHVPAAARPRSSPTAAFLSTPRQRPSPPLTPRGQVRRAPHPTSAWHCRLTCWKRRCITEPGTHSSKLQAAGMECPSPVLPLPRNWQWRAFAGYAQPVWAHWHEPQGLLQDWHPVLACQWCLYRPEEQHC